MTFCQWKGIPTMCGPRGLPGDTNILYHNNGDGTFTDVSEKAGILKPGPRYSITSVAYDFDIGHADRSDDRLGASGQDVGALGDVRLGRGLHQRVVAERPGEAGVHGRLHRRPGPRP